MAAHQIDQAAGNEERRDAARPLLVQNDRRLGYAVQAADAGADHHACFDLLLVGLGGPLGVPQRLSRRRDAVNDEIIDPSLFLRLHPVVGIEGVGSLAARNLGGDLASEVRYVEVFDPGHRRLAGQQSTPSRLDPAGQRRNHAEARHHNPFHQQTSRLRNSVSRPLRSASAGLQPRRDKGRTNAGPRYS